MTNESFTHIETAWSLFLLLIKAEKKEEENEDEETDLYCKLNNPSENVYMATMTSSKHNKGITHTNVLI